MKKRSWFLLILTFSLLIPLSALKAAETKSGPAVYVAPSEIVTGNLYAAGGSIVIDGTVTGDLIGAAQNIKINGELGGDLLAAADTMEINGKINGNARIAGNSLTINGKVLKNINAFGETISFGDKSLVGWDILAAAKTINLKGIIEGRVDAYAEKLMLSGKVNKDVNLKINGENQKLSLLPEAIINGSLNYSSQIPAEIANPKSVLGKIDQQTVPIKHKKDFSSLCFGNLLAFLAALATGTVLIFSFKKTSGKIIDNLWPFSLKNALLAVVFIFVLPIALLIAAITIIGLPLALIAGALYLIIIYLAKILTAFFVGKIIINKINKKKEIALFWSLLVGIIICWLIFALPYVGTALAFLATVYGLMGIIKYAKNQSGNI